MKGEINMRNKITKTIGGAVMVSAMFLSGCVASSVITSEGDWRDVERKEGIRGTSDLADHVTGIDWNFCDIIHGDGYYTNPYAIDLTVNLDTEVDGLYYEVRYDDLDLCREDVPAPVVWLISDAPDGTGLYDEADIRISFYDLYHENGELTDETLVLAKRNGSDWFLKSILCPGEYEITLYDRSGEAVWTVKPFVQYKEHGEFFSYTEGADKVIGRCDPGDSCFSSFSDMVCFYNGFSAKGTGWYDDIPLTEINPTGKSVTFKFTTDLAPDELGYQIYYAGSSNCPLTGSVWSGYQTPEGTANPNGTYTYTISYTGSDYYNVWHGGLPDGYYFLRITSADGSSIYAETMHAYGDAENGCYTIIG